MRVDYRTEELKGFYTCLRVVVLMVVHLGVRDGKVDNNFYHGKKWFRSEKRTSKKEKSR